MTPLGTQCGDTPLPTPLSRPSSSSQAAHQTQQKNYDPNLSLDEFCARYTSEDNSSFSEIVNNANKLKRLKYVWAFESSNQQNAKLLEATTQREKLIEMISKMAEGEEGVGLIEGMSGRPGERKMVDNVVTRQERLGIEASQRATPKLLLDRPDSEDLGTSKQPRGAKPVTNIDVQVSAKTQPVKNPNAWHHVTRNALMFGPDANLLAHEKPAPPPFPAAPLVALGGPQGINYANTRMTADDPIDELLRHAQSSSRRSMTTLSPTRSHIAAAINGTPCESLLPISSSVGPSPCPEISNYLT